ncbi:MULTISPECIES: hypothetical protein [Pedobacter]|uniref:hypothetical protein n=1 Tax=Pedobacter TaxID=84567 RepID=UPI00064930E8|nr:MULTISPECIES: hypothetical protein [Pedobacter]KLT67011.1 hypothetical protein AB669_03580 [Pedobacter sp. BMA]
MIKLAHSTPVFKLEKVKVGDEVIDDYQSHGKVVKVIKKAKDGIVEFSFHLDTKQTIFIMSKAV